MKFYLVMLTLVFSSSLFAQDGDVSTGEFRPVALSTSFFDSVDSSEVSLLNNSASSCSADSAQPDVIKSQAQEEVIKSNIGDMFVTSHSGVCSFPEMVVSNVDQDTKQVIDYDGFDAVPIDFNEPFVDESQLGRSDL